MLAALRALTRSLPGDVRLSLRRRATAHRGDPRRLRLVARPAGSGVPSHQGHPGRVGYGRQRAADGLREQGQDVGVGRRLLARRDHRRPEPERRLPARRAGRGRRVRRADTARHLPARGMAAGRLLTAHGHPARARAPLQEHAGHGVHRGGGPSLHAPDAQREASGPGGGALRGGRRGRGPADQGGRRSRRSTQGRSTRCCIQPSIRTPTTKCWRKGWPPLREPRRERSCSPPKTPWRPVRTAPR